MTKLKKAELEVAYDNLLKRVKELEKENKEAVLEHIKGPIKDW